MPALAHGTHARSEPPSGGAASFFGVFRYSRRAIELVWSTSRPLTVALAALTLAAGLLPAAVAYVGQLIVDAVVAAIATRQETGSVDIDDVIVWVVTEAGLVVALAGAQRGISMCESLLRAMLGHRVNVLILEKALTLTLPHFEDSEFYDKLTRARRQASQRPLSLVRRTFGLVQNGISLLSYGTLLWQFSPWAVLILAVEPAAPARLRRREAWCRSHRANDREPGLQRPPFTPGPGGLRLGPDDGRVDHQPFQVWILRHPLEDPVEHTVFNPPIVSALHSLMRPEALGQITPAPAGPGHPQQCIEKPPAIAAWTALALPTAWHEGLKPSPLIVAQHFAFQS